MHIFSPGGRDRLLSVLSMAKSKQRREISLGWDDGGNGEGTSSTKRAKSGKFEAKKVWKLKNPKVLTRSNPALLVKAMAGFTNFQKDAVVEMGFGGLLSLRITEYPSSFIWWLIENFNPISCELVLAQGRFICVDYSDVERVLVFPNGPINIYKKTKSKQNDLYDNCAGLFGKTVKLVTTTEVCNKMVECKDDGVLYMDRVVVCMRDMPRGIPSLIGWTDEKLKEQYRNEVTYGFFQVFTSEVLSKLFCLATDIVDIINILQNAPKDFECHSIFEKLGAAAKNLICFNRKQVDGQPTDDIHDFSLSQQNDAFWNNRENIAIIEKIENALVERVEFKKWINRSTFSIGITQDGGTANWQFVLETTRHYAEASHGNMVEEIDNVGGVVGGVNIDAEIMLTDIGADGTKKDGNTSKIEKKGGRKLKKLEPLASPITDIY
ncbi:hypothetical protein DH2020_019719 [Rehmannia glutinosa]|uniref:Uncharacterized protein n=1 Tax=Rehmannia glutinosa TaxID=99300 RepID=A0ABR0WFB2_REHGL